MQQPAPIKQRFTYGDYCHWPDDERWESDLSVICDPAQLDDAGCRGAPDWVV